MILSFFQTDEPNYFSCAKIFLNKNKFQGWIPEFVFETIVYSNNCLIWRQNKASHHILMKFCRNGRSFWSAITFYALRKSLSFFRHSGHVLQWNRGGWNRVGHLSEKDLIQNFTKLTINSQFYFETKSFGNYLTYVQGIYSRLEFVIP